MVRLSTWMTLFWTLAEGSILIAMHWGLTRLQGSRYSEARMMIGATLFALVVIIYALGREWLFWHSDLDFGDRQLTIYRTFTWNLLCTLWVILEASIALYAWRIYQTLKCNPVKPRNYRIPLIVLIVAPFALFFAYHSMAWSVIASTEIDAQQVVNLGRFYIRLCGVLWISIEWFIAIMGFRMILLLRQPDAANV
jgi:hypothetical protein